MLGTILLLILILIEMCFITLSMIKKMNFKRERAIARILLLVIFIFLILLGVINFGFQWYSLGLLLIIQTILGAVVLIRKKEYHPTTNFKNVFYGLNRILLLCFIFTPILIFPQYKPIKPTGNYKVDTSSYTLTDDSREEQFTKENDHRNVTIQFWYPSNDSNAQLSSNKYPLVIFSHGAFGFRMSNYSTYEELASHGYIVASIDHTYHAFITRQTDGKNIIANKDFFNQVMSAQNGDIKGEELYQLENEWMELRTADMNFVLDYIKEESSRDTAEGIYSLIDLDHIGVMGHSLGGATAAKIGRIDTDIDAVIVIDGTMMGEIIAFENGKDIITNDPYPIPLLNIYNESHYQEATETKDYPNMVAYTNALDGYQVVVNGSGHMSFTDLPIISPFLSKLLETSKDVTIDPEYCIETTNQVILEFFDKYLKDNDVEIKRDRTY
jgi:dienelactone hydrolase